MSNNTFSSNITVPQSATAFAEYPPAFMNYLFDAIKQQLHIICHVSGDNFNSDFDRFALSQNGKYIYLRYTYFLEMGAAGHQYQDFYLITIPIVDDHIKIINNQPAKPKIMPLRDPYELYQGLNNDFVDIFVDTDQSVIIKHKDKALS